MLIEDLDLNTRNKIYNHTKKVIRKYQKGINSGKLTAEKFADNIFSDNVLSSILDEAIISEADFQNSYVDYIDTLMKKQSQNFKDHLDNKYNKNNKKSNITLQIHLKNILKDSPFSLNIPIKYLNSKDIEAIIEYLETGNIQLGNEKIYKYVSENKVH